MAFDPATDIPDISKKTFVITGGKAFTNLTHGRGSTTFR